MNLDFDFRENFSNLIKNSLTKPHLTENSPSKIPVKISRFNLKIFEDWNTEKKKAPIDSYTRIKSHSSTKPKRQEDFESPLCKKLFYEIDNLSYQRSISRNFRPFKKSIQDREIEHLNFRIRNLIKEKNELKTKIDDQNSLIEIIQGNPRPSDCSNAWNSKDSENSLEVTFKPKENWEFHSKNSKKFPRDIFRTPRIK